MATSIVVRSKMKRARTLLDQGLAAEARALCAQLCRTDKINTEAWFLLGLANKALGRGDEALHALLQAAALSPRNAFVQNEAGMLLAQAGRHREALDAFRLALADAPDPATVHVNLGVVHGRMGRHDLALAAFDQAAGIEPRAPAPHIQRSVVLGMLGRYEEALHAAEQALCAARGSLEANIRYAEALVDMGLYAEALAAYGDCLAIAPGYGPSRQRVIEICRVAVVQVPAAAHFTLLQRAYGWRNINFQDMAPFAASVFKARAGFMDSLEGALADDNLSPETHLETLSTLATAHCLYFEGLLTQGLLEDAQLERATTGFRARLLRFLWAQRAVFDSGLPVGIECLLDGLARQAFNNEYLWGSMAAEDALQPPLREEIETSVREFVGGAIAPKLALRIWMLALYRPLHETIPEIQGLALAVAAGPRLKQVLTMQCADYWQEQRIGRGIATLTPIAAGVTAAVRRQYEENPYPCWQSLPPVEAVSPTVSLGGLFVDGMQPDYLGRPMEILIAGCGTGRHSIQTARRFPASRVTAVDLSRASLAYALRKTNELHIENIDYFQADIMALGNLERRFHLVESIGVLHHLEDPAAGWRILVSLLQPGGLMHIALYSRIARAALDFARASIKDMALGNDPDSIRTFRKQVLDAPAGTALANVANLGRDFYSLSNCRDLLFHVQEHRFTLPQIAALLQELGLEFRAMEVDSCAAEAYRQFNPTDPGGTDLEGWHRFELEHPSTFAGMYQFWCQKRG